jgi:hypothetical protein
MDGIRKSSRNWLEPHMLFPYFPYSPGQEVCQQENMHTFESIYEYHQKSGRQDPGRGFGSYGPLM